jgi:hypothetical protein
MNFRVAVTNTALQFEYLARSYCGCKWGILYYDSGKSSESEGWNFTSEGLVETKRARPSKQSKFVVSLLGGVNWRHVAGL